MRFCDMSCCDKLSARPGRLGRQQQRPKHSCGCIRHKGQPLLRGYRRYDVVLVRGRTGPSCFGC